jgi:hypothetical protein
VAGGWRPAGTGVTLTDMTIKTAKLSDPAVRAFVTAVNASDREGLVQLLTSDATMADDGSDRNLDDWIDREIFSSNGHIDVDNESNGGRSLIAHYRNDTWGEMVTRWDFTVEDDGRISRFETGQG